MPTDPLSPSPLVVVTGCSGLIGTRVMRNLVDSFQVVGLDLRPPSSDLHGVSFIRCDLTRQDAVEAAAEEIRREHGTRIASVVHLAAHVDFSGASSPLYEELTVEGTRRLLRAMRPMQVEQFVFSSTILVLKEAEPGSILDERSPLEAKWDYPRSKIRAEEVVRQERGDIPAVILRMAGAYDEYGHSPPVVQQIRRIYERKLESHLFPGDTDRGQPFVHLEDLVAAVRQAIERRRMLRALEVFTIAEPEILTYGELQDGLGKLIHGKNWATIRVPSALAKAGAWVKDRLTSRDMFIKPWMVDLADTHLPVSIARARDVLGWEPKHRLREALPQIVHHLKQDPDGFYRENDLAA